ncbi:MAG: DUF2891 family protein, partial [Pseudomonadota bacterium]
MQKMMAVVASYVLLSTVCLAAAEESNEDYETVFTGLALECIHREYSNKVALFMNSDEDLKPPRELYPVFYGCFDWHSSVHGHWLLVRMLNTSADKVDAGA